MLIRPALRLRGRVRVPGDKSISHRAAILAALSAGEPVRVSYFSTSDDCASTLRCLEQLGVGVRRTGATVEIAGAGLGLPRAPDAALDCGNSGTTMRLLAGVLAGQNFSATLDGDSSLRSRPMRRVIAPLELMGARIASHDGRAPLHVEGRGALRPVEYEMPVASAQVKSCVLLAGLYARGRTSVIERHGMTRDHTERLLDWFGVEVETTPGRAPRDERDEHTASDEHVASGDLTGPASVSLVGGQTLRARDVDVPGDISSAAFFLVAAALLAGSELRLEGVGLNPTRAQLVDTLRALGADLSVENEATRSNEPTGDIVVRGAGTLASARGAGTLAPARGDKTLASAREGANVLRGGVIASLIDELPILAVAGTRIQGGLEIRDARELRVKETDRVRAVCENLRAMGARVEEFEDGLAVAGPVRLRGARVSSYGDHRIAMAFAVAALLAEGETEIEGADCAAVSFPEFFRLLASVAER